MDQFKFIFLQTKYKFKLYKFLNKFKLKFYVFFFKLKLFRPVQHILTVRKVNKTIFSET